MRAAGITALGEPVEIFEVDELATPAAGEVQYEDVYRLCYVRGPEGILIGLAEQIG
jgi:hypothetical protein